MRAARDRWAAATTVAAVGVVLLVGCDDAAETTDAPEFVACVEDAGLSLSGKEDWEQSEWEDFFSQPEALTCAVDELGEEERREALGEAFPQYWQDGPNDPSYDSYFRRQAAFADYASVTTRDRGRDEALAGARALVESLEWHEAAGADATVLVVVVAVLAEQGQLPGLDAFLQKHSFENRPEGLHEYGTELINNEGRLNDRVRNLYHGVTESFDASSLVP